ncbi:MAG: hypothetical protein K5683_07105, partial [Prevotella sp.]|nr:hypothetical protein [Prevotella sp.]
LALLSLLQKFPLKGGEWLRDVRYRWLRDVSMALSRMAHSAWHSAAWHIPHGTFRMASAGWHSPPF